MIEAPSQRTARSVLDADSPGIRTMPPAWLRESTTEPWGRAGTRALNIGMRRSALLRSSSESCGGPPCPWAWKITIPSVSSIALVIAGIIALPLHTAPWPALER